MGSISTVISVLPVIQPILAASLVIPQPVYFVIWTINYQEQPVLDAQLLAV